LVLEYSKLNAIPVNDCVVVCTKDNGQGWQMNKGDVILFEYNGFPVDDIEDMSVGLIKNDILFSKQRQSLELMRCHLIIPENGLYHLCILTDDMAVGYY